MPNFNFSKYKRFFAFGCSFTSNEWPTWANLIAREMPSAAFYNYGLSGAGNIYIAAKVAECNNVYKFNKDDLIIILWSTFVREDRFVGDRWESHGSVYYSHFYDESFRKKYFDVKGYVIRDLALMELTNGYLDSLPCDHYDMISVNPNGTQDAIQECSVEQKFIDEEVLPTYKKLLSRYKVSYYDVYPWNEFVITDDGHKDSHPSPLQAYNFLKILGYNLSQATHDYAVQETEFLFNPHRRGTLRERYFNLNYTPAPIIKKTFKNKYGC